MAYYVTWLPHYDRYVVTASADCPDSLGYCDFELGAFSIKTPVKEGARKIICADRSKQNRAYEQPRWAYLFSTELISQQEAEAWAERVWPSERGEQAEDDFYRRVDHRCAPPPATVKRPEAILDLEKIIDELMYRKKALPLESAEYQFIDRMLTGLRKKEREQRKLDPRRQDLVRRIVEGHPETKWGPKELQELHDEPEAWGE